MKENGDRLLAPALLFGDHHVTLPEGAKLTPIRITDEKEKADIIQSWRLSHPEETNLPLFVFDTQDVPLALTGLVEFRTRRGSII